MHKYFYDLRRVGLVMSVVGATVSYIKKGKLMNKVQIAPQFCNFCERVTEFVLVHKYNPTTREGWSEEECRWCFEAPLDWDDLYG